MKNLFIRAWLILLLLSFGMPIIAEAQRSLLRRLQEKTEEKIIEEVIKEPKSEKNPDNKTTQPDVPPQARNQRGGGLTQELPDVNRCIDEASEAFGTGKFVEARLSVRNALWGVELEIGQNVLNALPQKVDSLDYDVNDDRVTSTGIGFIGLIIERTYRGNDDTEVRASVGNDSAILGMAGLYMSEGLYMQSTGQTNHKQIRFQDHRATVEYSDYEGYTLSVPFGQSSLFVVKGVNIDSESKFMAAANTFDIKRIKKELGEP